MSACIARNISLIEDMTGVMNWISRYLREAGKSKVVLGLSGGLDSAVTAALAAEVLGARNVIAVAMPCESDPADLEDARLIAEKLGITFIVEDLTADFFAKSRTLSRAQIEKLPEDQRLAARIRMGNVKARMRMLTLYDVAACEGEGKALVIGTCNKSEIDIGYETKYGDSGCDFNPLAEFYKTEVYKMARMLPLPSWILNRIPSAGLWEGQTDMDELGLSSYTELDLILVSLGRISNPPGVDSDSVSRIAKMHEISKHKRNMPPVYKRPLES